MPKYIATAIVLLALVGGYYFSNSQATPEPMENEVPSAVHVIPISHATGILKWGTTTIYFDPIGGAEAFAGQPPANIVLVTDIHSDHFSTSTIAAVLGNATLIVPEAVRDLLPTDVQTKATVLANEQSLTERGLTITAIPMYNLPDAENKDRHVKGRGNGYLLENNGMRVYIAGDTAGTPEMRALTDIDIAFVPMNMPYTMSVEEAADAVLAFKPSTVYPYHYRTPEGLADVNKFKQLVNAGNPNITVILGTWYPAE